MAKTKTDKDPEMLCETITGKGCGLKKILGIIGGKWKILILCYIDAKGIGRFGDLWWAGIRHSDRLAALVKSLRHVLADEGIPFDRKRFSPHITLIRKASRDAAGIPITPETMTVRTISLMSSKRGRNGMIYTEVGTIETKENPVQMPVEL